MRKGLTLALAILATAVLEYGGAVLAKEKNKTATVTVANLNIFHGIPCALVEEQKPGEPITQCRLADRIDLLFKHLVAIGCPDIVTLQEVVHREFVESFTPEGGLVTAGPLVSALNLIKDHLQENVCGYKEVIYGADPAIPLDQRPLFEGTDEELILSRYPVMRDPTTQKDIKAILLLHSALYVPGEPNLQFFARHVLFARIDHPVGPLDVFTTHLAASEDFGDNPCNSEVTFPPALFPPQGLQFTVSCPAECDPSQTVRACEARQVANFVKGRHVVSEVPTPAFITGDFNAKPRSAVYKEIIRAEHGRKHRWIDSYLAADNAECNRHTGIGCSAVRDAVSGDLESPALNVDERSDYIFVVPSAPALECKIREQGTGLFADQPNPFEDEQCGPSGPICWASDHNGTRAKLSCKRSADHDFSLASR